MWRQSIKKQKQTVTKESVNQSLHPQICGQLIIILSIEENLASEKN
jgi:hypothetical protein